MIVHTYVYKHAHSYNIEEISYIYIFEPIGYTTGHAYRRYMR